MERCYYDPKSVPGLGRLVASSRLMSAVSPQADFKSSSPKTARAPVHAWSMFYGTAAWSSLRGRPLMPSAARSHSTASLSMSNLKTEIWTAAGGRYAQPSRGMADQRIIRCSGHAISDTTEFLVCSSWCAPYSLLSFSNM